MSNVQVYNKEQKRSIAEQIWLQYYNQVLFERGMITEEEHNRMANRVNARYCVTGSKQNRPYPIDNYMLTLYN